MKEVSPFFNLSAIGGRPKSSAMSSKKLSERSGYEVELLSSCDWRSKELCVGPPPWCVAAPPTTTTFGRGSSSDTGVGGAEEFQKSGTYG